MLSSLDCRAAIWIRNFDFIRFQTESFQTFSEPKITESEISEGKREIEKLHGGEERMKRGMREKKDKKKKARPILAVRFN